MSTHTITIDQIKNQKFGNDIIQDGFIIQRYDDHPNMWDVYPENGSTEPIFKSESPQAIVDFLNVYETPEEFIFSFDDLVNLIKSLSPKYDVEDKDVFWFIAMQLAEEYEDMSTKDLAKEIYNGIPKIDKEYTEEWLELYFDDWTFDDLTELLIKFGYTKDLIKNK